MRNLFPVVLNITFALCIFGIIMIPIELNMPAEMTLKFYIISALSIILVFGLTYTIIDIRNILLNIDKNLKKIGTPSQNLQEELATGGTNEVSSSEATVQKVAKGESASENENRLICPFCGADYSEYPNATACFNCHKFFDQVKKS